MHLTNETRRGGGAGLAKVPSVAGSFRENTIPTVIVNRLRQRFGVSEPHALTILRLASLGPKEGRD